MAYHTCTHLTLTASTHSSPFPPPPHTLKRLRRSQGCRTQNIRDFPPPPHFWRLWLQTAMAESEGGRLLSGVSQGLEEIGGAESHPNSLPLLSFSVSYYERGI